MTSLYLRIELGNCQDRTGDATVLMLLAKT